ncbi:MULTISPECIES: spore coat protein [Bacillaceae]|uniref:Spore coat protein n=1 Tax=Evansella alkalicola TaxID=745819 RepID=A0ABS6JYR9_9BACI|nr:MULTISPECIES: spore coat protein [Bacillaceae]MBU9723741.1 spore coat protein [Bacillus alkalicola]
MEKKHLAWHETLEIHELVAFQANGLMKLKKSLPDVKNEELKKIFQKAISEISNNLNELLLFYPNMPRDVEEPPQMPRDEEEPQERDDMTAFFAGDLLGLAKATVRNYSIAITETATPQVRKTLKKQLTKSIDLHAEMYEFMEKQGLYPAYNLKELLDGDVKTARKAMSMKS